MDVEFELVEAAAWDDAGPAVLVSVRDLRLVEAGDFLSAKSCYRGLVR